ncbi:TRAP transporter small permease [Oricola sp.]|uniref:TRAP transporter small permease n=1 Tax=Oricola sp. TaxID=1979950 RepID=UPI003BAD6E83
MATTGADRGGAVARAADRWLTPVFTGLAVLAALAGGAIVVLIGASVAMRHAVNAPFRFTEELVGLLMTAAFFLALPLVTLRAEHVRVHLIVGQLPPAAARVVAFAAGAFGIVFCLWYFYLCLPWFEFAFQRNIKTEVARLLMYPWMAVIPVSLLLTSLAFAVRAVAGEPPTKANG